MAFQKAVKYNSRLRMAIAGPSGSGKTWTSLTLAIALADGQGVALIDTEHGSASKYADTFDFDVSELTNFHPQKYIDAIHEAEQAGYAVLVIDSLSHAWNGTGGLLEVVEGITKRSSSKNSFNAWGEATPLQNRLIDTIIASPMHIICTMRTKTEYVVEVHNGKSAPRKVGTAPIQRADIEYEFDVYADMDVDNTMIVQKSRCSTLSGQVISKPDGQVAEMLQSWLQGAPVSERPIPALTIEERRRVLYDRALELGQFQKGRTQQENREAFLAFVVPIIDAAIVNVEQLTASRLDTIEAYLNAQDAA